MVYSVIQSPSFLVRREPKLWLRNSVSICWGGKQGHHPCHFSCNFFQLLFRLFVFSVTVTVIFNVNKFYRKQTRFIQLTSHQYTTQHQYFRHKSSLTVRSLSLHFATENTQNQVMHTAWLTLRKECILVAVESLHRKKCSFHMAEGLTPQQQEVETSLDKESDKVWETSRNVQSSKTSCRLVQGCVAVLTARDTCLFCSFLQCPVAVRDFQQCWSDWTQTWLSGY